MALLSSNTPEICEDEFVTTGNHLEKLHIVELLGKSLILLSLLHSTACSTFSGGGQKWQLTLKSQQGRTEELKIRSVSAKKSVGEDQISRNDIERVDFRLKSKTIEVSPTGEIVQEHRLTEKQGQDLDLRDMGYPELGESLQVRYSPEARVLEAGKYPKNSVFFVTPVSLPEEKVAVGDTWELDASWQNMKNHIKMYLNMVTLFQRVVPCGLSQCADLEISGDVKIPALKGFANANIEISGRVLFDIENGMVVWQEIRNKEQLTLQNLTINVESCLNVVAVTPRVEGISELDLGCSVPFEERVSVPL